MKKVSDDGSFNNKDVNQHQLDFYHKMYLNKSKTKTPGTSETEVFNIVGQLQSLERIIQTGELEHTKMEELPTYGKPKS